MTETQFTSKLVRALRERLGPGAVVLKHADAYTAGIPDISITQGRDTLWIEAKLITNPKLFEPLQLAMLRRMEGHYVIWDPKLRIGFRFHAASIAPVSGLQKYKFRDLVENILNEVR